MGSSGDSGVAKRQEQMERERLAAIQSGIAATNQIFEDPARAAQYEDFLAAQRQEFFRELGDQKKDADRQLKFALARSGQYGGRQQIDAGTRLGEQYQRGIINADRLAQGATNDLRMADQDARARIIAMIQSGADVTTASNAALSSLQSNMAGARANMNAEALGTVFGGLSDLYKRSQERAEERRARRDLGSLYGTAPQWGYGQPQSRTSGGW